MNKFTCLILAWLLMGLLEQATPASGDASGFQLTIELRDGSRVVGQISENTLSLHSATLGDIKLSWAGVRQIEYAGDTDAARLTATNGDAFTVQLSTDALSLQTVFGKTELPVNLIRSIKVSPQANSNVCTGNGTGLALTVELRDGSRLVGKALDETLNFHSAAMGDLKLKWDGIRSIQFATSVTEPAQLTATNGDVYEVQLAAPMVRVETSFGLKELPVKLIRSINVSTEGVAGEHLVGWWKLDEGGGTVARDSSSSQPPHDGNLINGPTWLQNTSQTGGCLQFNGTNQYVSLGHILQGSYSEISIACWIKHSGPGAQTIVERSVWDNSDGIDLMVDGSSVQFGHYNMKVFSKASVDDQWHHLVGTMSPSENGGGYLYSLYVDGKLDNTAVFPMGLTATSNGWGIGAVYNGTWFYQGLIKDVRIYDCALTASEVQAIYSERGHGEPSPTAFLPAIEPVKAAFNGNIK